MGNLVIRHKASVCYQLEWERYHENTKNVRRLFCFTVDFRSVWAASSLSAPSIHSATAFPMSATAIQP